MVSGDQSLPHNDVGGRRKKKKGKHFFSVLNQTYPKSGGSLIVGRRVFQRTREPPSDQRMAGALGYRNQGFCKGVFNALVSALRNYEWGHANGEEFVCPIDRGLTTSGIRKKDRGKSRVAVDAEGTGEEIRVGLVLLFGSTGGVHGARNRGVACSGDVWGRCSLRGQCLMAGLYH